VLVWVPPRASGDGTYDDGVGSEFSKDRFRALEARRVPAFLQGRMIVTPRCAQMIPIG